MIKNIIKFTPILAFVAVAVALATSNPASAASAYDNAIQPVVTPNLELYDGGIFGGPTTEPFDVSTTWTQWIINDDYWCTSSGEEALLTSESFQTEVFETGGSWSVTINNSYALGKSYSTIHIYWTPTPGEQLTGYFSDSPYQRFYIDGDQSILHWQIIPNAFGSGTSGSNTTGFCGQSVGLLSDATIAEISNQYGNTSTTSSSPTNVGVFLFNSTDFEYPTDYEGSEIPGELEEPAPENTNVPQWYVSSILDFKAKIHDTNFNTFDGTPFLCADDLAPVLHYEIWRNTDPQVLITSGVQSSTLEINYDFGRSDTDREYEIVGWYECADEEYNFTEQGRIFLTINRAGTLAVDLFEACVSETFPFIYPEECINNMYTVINLLAFGEVTFPNFTYNPACQNLNTFDDWLGLPANYQVCPQFPSTVRNIVTPFVAFMLGLVTMKFLHRRTGDFNG